MVLLQQFSQSFVEGGAKPIHSPVDNVLDGRVPSIVLGQGLNIVHHVQSTMAVLEASEIALVSISDSEDKIAGSSRCFHSGDGFLDLSIELKNIPQNERKWVSETTFFPESCVWVGNSNF